MDTKIKVIIVLFIAIAVGYAIYFIVNDVNNQKTSRKQDKRITETYEDYDIRKQILSQLDNYDISKKTKNKIYEDMSNNIERFKEMPEDDVNDFISKVISSTKSSAGSSKEKDNADKVADKEDKDDKYIAVEPAEVVVPPTIEAVNSSTKETFDQSYSNNIKVVIDTATAQINTLNSNLKQIQSLVDTMALKCQASSQTQTPSSVVAPSQVPLKAPAPKGQAQGLVQTQPVVGVQTQPPSSSPPIVDVKPSTPTPPVAPGIEGFENFSGRGYSFL